MTSYCIVAEFLTANLFHQLVTHFVHRQGLLKPSGREHYGARMLDELGALKEPLAAAMVEALPDVAPRCGLAAFSSGSIVEMRVMSRSTGPPVAILDQATQGRGLGFMLFVHREPRRFEGGALCLASCVDEYLIEPSQNSMVFFASSLAARVDAIRAASGSLIDSLLTLEGWIRDGASPLACDSLRSASARCP